METICIGFVLVFSWMNFTGLQRKFSPETLINGFMDEKKAKELAPSILKKASK